MHTTQDLLPLTSAQTSIWWDAAYNDTPQLHTMGDYLDVRGEVDLAQLRAGFEQLFREAETLRVQFTTVDGVPFQEIRDDISVPLEIYSSDTFRAAQEAGRVDIALQDMHERVGRPILLTDEVFARVVCYPVSQRRVLCLFLMHHVSCDGYSRVALYERLQAILRKAQGPALPPLHALVEDEREYQKSDRTKERAFWESIATELPEAVTLSTGKQEPGTSHLRATATLESQSVNPLRELAQRNQTGLASALVTLTGLYIAKITGESRTALSFPVTARTSADIRRTPGMLANYPPLVIDANPWGSVDETLRAGAKSILRVMKNQRFRSEEIQRLAGRELQDTRPFGPYVNVIPQNPTLTWEGATAVVNNLSTGAVEDFMFTLLETGDGGVEVHANGNPALYSRAEVEQHAAELTNFLALVARQEDSAVPTGELSVSTRSVSTIQGDKPAPFTDVYGSIATHAAVRGSKIAVVDASGAFTYAELIRRAEAVARTLRSGEVVGLLAQAGRSFVAGMLACLKAGAAWTPLDVDAPMERRLTVLAESGANVILASEDFEDHALELRDAVSRTNTIAPRILQLDAPVLDSRLPNAVVSPSSETKGPSSTTSRDSVAYVLFTSGTTGKPKGAMVHHAGLANHLRSKIELLKLTDADSIIQNAPVTFDVSIWQILAPLMVGGTTHPVTKAQAADPDEIARIVTEHGVTHLEVVPSFLRVALELWKIDEATLFENLKTLMVTGEVLPKDLIAAWFDVWPKIPMINAYGPTECSDDVSHAVLGETPRSGIRAPIGTAIPGSRLMVLGADLQPVPAGVVGELYVGGVCVGRGYLGDARKTSVTFVPDPWGEPGARMYRSGDHVLLNSQGQLEFVERRDQQVKINGQRIELGEVEQALRDAPSAQDAAAGVASAGTTKRLVGYVVPADQQISQQEFLEQLTSELESTTARHVIPTLWVVLPQLPLTAHGKIDRKRLPDPLATNAFTSGDPQSHAQDLASSEETGASQTSEESVMAIISGALADVLSLPHVTENDDFFALGGDSISAIQVASKLKSHGLRMRPNLIFEFSKVGALAKHLAAEQGAHLSSSDPGLSPGNGNVSRSTLDVGVLEPTPILKQMFEDLGSLRGAAARYAQTMTFDLPAGSTAQDVAAVMDHLRAVHPLLGMRFMELGAGSSQRKKRSVDEGIVWSAVVDASVTGGWVSDSQGDIESDRQSGLEDLDPLTGVTWRAFVHEGVNPQLTLVIHHSIVDGVSWRILQEDFATCLAQLRAGEPLSAKSEGTSFWQWTRITRDLANEPHVVRSELAQWLAKDPHSLVRPRRELENGTWGDTESVVAELGVEESRILLSPGQRWTGARTQDVLLAALESTLTGAASLIFGKGSRVDGALQNDETLPDMKSLRVAVEVEGHGREDLTEMFTAHTSPLVVEHYSTDTTRTIGWFTTTFPVYLELDERNQPHQRINRLIEQREQHQIHGMGHGLVAEINPLSAQLFTHETPAIGFNYLGKFDAGNRSQSGVKVHWADAHSLPLATLTAPDLKLRHSLAVTAAVVSREEGEHLLVEFRAARSVLEAHEVQALHTSFLAALRMLSQSESASDNNSAVTHNLTPVQTGMILHSQQHAFDVDPYVFQAMADIEGPLDRERLEAAINRLLETQPVLGLRVDAAGDGRLVARYGNAPFVTVRLIDGIREEDAESLEQSERSVPFSFVEGPLIRCLLYRKVPCARDVSDAEAAPREKGASTLRLVWTMHHAVADGWSIQHIFGDLLALYEGREISQRPSVVSMPRPSLGQALFDEEHAKGQWRTYLAGLSGPSIVSNIASSQATANNLAHTWENTIYRPEIPLDEAARAAKTTPNTLVAIAWGAALQEHLHQDDVIFGTVASVREHLGEDAESAVGMYLRTLPTRIHLKPGESVEMLVSRVHHELSQLRNTAELSLGAMLSTSPQVAAVGEGFDTAVVFENFPTKPLASSDFRMSNFSYEDHRHFPLSVVVSRDESGSYEFRFDINPEVLSHEEAHGFAKVFAQALESLASRPGLMSIPEHLKVTLGSKVQAVKETHEAKSASNQREQSILDAFEQVLQQSLADVNASFFALGGDSISVVRLVAALRELDIRVTPQQVYLSPTPAELALTSNEPEETAAVADSSELLDLSEEEMSELEIELGLSDANSSNDSSSSTQR